MKNLVYDEGKIVQHKHNADVTSGQVLIVGALLLVAMGSYAANVEGSYRKKGVFELPKASGTAFSVGDKLYWNGTALTKTAEDQHYAGICDKAQESADVLAWCDINTFTPETQNNTP